MLSRVLLVASLVAALAIVFVPGPATAQEASPCRELLPALDWAQASPEVASLWYVGVDDEIAARFAETADRVARWITADLTPGRLAEVCLVGPSVDVSALGVVGPGEQFHAAAFSDEGAVVIATRPLSLLDRAIGFGMAYVALWDVAHDLDLAGYPEPLGTTIARWYGTRVVDRIDRHHSTMRAANLLGTGSQIDWVIGTQQPVLVWNEEFNESALDDMVDYAVATVGSSVLRNPDGLLWRQIEADWRAALRFELTGRTTPTTGWIVGLVMVSLLLAAAIGLAWQQRIAKRRNR